MSRFLLASLACLVAVAAPRAAAAQTPPVVPLDTFLEQRVAEELAADGTILSRLGVALDIELVGDRLLISLVDPATRRAVASTKLDAVPPDREAAVASVTQVAAGLAAQLSSSGSQTTAAVRTMLDQDREERRNRDEAEHKYRQEALSFGDEIVVAASGNMVSVGRRWVAYQGEIRKRLDGEQFYQVIGRADLAAGYRTRRNTGIGLWVGGIGIWTASIIYWGSKLGGDDCEFDDPNYDACNAKEDAERSRGFKVGIAGTIIGGGLFAIGLYLHRNPHPISESEASDLGRAHNNNLRKRYGLPALGLRDVQLAPYAAASGGGLVLGGRF